MANQSLNYEKKHMVSISHMSWTYVRPNVRTLSFLLSYKGYVAIYMEIKNDCLSGDIVLVCWLL